MRMCEKCPGECAICTSPTACSTCATGYVHPIANLSKCVCENGYF